MTNGAGVVACGCNNFPNKAGTVWKSAGKQKKKKLKADRQTKIDVQHPASTTEKTREAVETPANKTD